ncbi:MAG: SDR family oxidoreductase [Cyanobacteria bacterium]|nr:SDR family oxidoreductase [Cyanobacteriota bacterium]
MSYTFNQKVVFVTGANRGIGAALVRALLKQPVSKIYAAARDLQSLPNFGDARVVPIKLDIADRISTAKAANDAADTQVLFNNAGALSMTPVLEGPLELIARDMDVNYYGTLNATRAFVPVLEANAGTNGAGAILNTISIVGLSPMAGVAGYSASKAALHSLTQSLRTLLKPKNITVHGIYPGPIDTDMAKDFDLPKTSADETAANILNAYISGQEDIFPDGMSAQLSQLWDKNPKELERQFAAM